LHKTNKKRELATVHDQWLKDVRTQFWTFLMTYHRRRAQRMKTRRIMMAIVVFSNMAAVGCLILGKEVSEFDIAI